jgi:3-methyladenine DNA glycosylase AlkD
MKLAAVLKQLDADAKGKTRVMMGPLRALGKKIGNDHALALELWATGRTDAMMLATMLMAPAELSAKQAEGMLAPLTDHLLVDELTYKVVADAPCADDLTKKWVGAKKELTARAGWNLLVGRLMRNKVPSSECDAILKTIEKDKRAVPVKTQESMMRCLAEIGARFPEHRKRAIDIGTQWGVIDDRPVSKGCTPFHAVLWIEALIKQRK